MANLRNTGKVLRSTTVVDSETGEVKEFTQETIIPKEPDFIKLYVNDLIMLSNIPKWVSGILYELLGRMNYQNEIILNSEIKRRISNDLNILPKTIDNALVSFVKNGILYRTGKGVYLANPFLFGKGEWNNIRKIRLSVSYGKNGKEIEGIVERSEPGYNLVDK